MKLKKKVVRKKAAPVATKAAGKVDTGHRYDISTREGQSRRTTFFVTEKMDIELMETNQLANKVLGTKDKKHISLAAALRGGVFLYLANEKANLKKAAKGELHAKKRKQ